MMARKKAPASINMNRTKAARLIIVCGVDSEEAVECLPALMTVFGMLAKYLNGVLHVKKLREVCEMIRSDNERLIGLPEYDVLHMHAMQGRKFLEFFLGALIVLLTIYLALPTGLIINDLISNVTENRYSMYPVSFIFIDERDHYLFRTVHAYASSLLIPFILYSLDSIYITFTQHACAMFAVVGYRLKSVHILNTSALRKEFDSRKYEKLLFDEQERMYEKLVLCIKEHKRALECTEIVQSAFSVTLFIQIMLNIVLLSITGVQTLLKLINGRLTDVAMLIIWMMGDHLHLFFLYFPGQRLLDFSTQVYFDALDCLWYNCFKKSRVVYQIMIMNTIKPVKLTALKIAPLNMEAFLSGHKIPRSLVCPLPSPNYFLS
ncbi:uncharacterized protein LOC143188341 [Calliopsis andreniformis]|uniref:uncharacterized protein LOC143188341 n=1 Tax=Calliopsis andreniformis TaxID=337506 RepID=UPI003FCD0812